ncbi:CGNR zinc finger domain-containing protein [Salsipaludibacter albus]|uniref:CGNR zinc finger domain-containing protein n=1 Tax=Salsipaludibacter albus TaxID=2849650 RepID=UPI001EE4CA4A|nr:CGNR zinc finger domain-containing protein [Salsipaludibacter albus]MBY5164228.1 CGNR zinc finger domain-containing protein [Salsipaludibacter albus]
MSPTGARPIDYDTFTDQTVSEAVDLTNLFARADEPVTAEELHRLLHLYVLVDEPVDVGAFAELAKTLRGVFEAADASERVALLNDLLAAHEPHPFIAEHDGQAPHFHYVSDDGADVRRVGASLAMALSHVVVDDGAERLGACRATTCRNVFVDRTRNRSQQFCSKTCATRVHVAAHRARAPGAH